MALPARHEKRYTRGCIAQHRGQLQPPINTKTQRHQDTKKAAGSAQRPSCLWYVQFGGPASMKDVVIISAVRTPIGKFQGALKSITAPQLGSIVVRNAVERAGLFPDQIDEVIMGNVVSAGLGQNPARQAALRGGLLPDVAAMTINKVCGSGLKAVGLAAQGIQTGDSEIVVAGGMESMTNAPYLLPGAREGYRLGHSTIVDSMI